MMATIFIILFLAVAFAFAGKRYLGMPLFALSMLLSIGWFLHHITSHLTLQL